ATTEIYTLSLHDALPICIEHRNRPSWRAHAALSVGLKGRRTGTLSGRGRVASGQEGQDLADGAFPPVRFGQRAVCLDVVAVAAAVLLLDHVTGLDQVGDDAEGAAFGDVQAGR